MKIKNSMSFQKLDAIDSKSDQKNITGRVPPHALDLEESVLGAIILEKNSLTLVIDILKEESFYKYAHQKIYQGIIQLFNNSESIDLNTLINQLKKNGTLNVVGGSYYIAKLTTKISSSANIEFHARIIVEYYIKRSLINITTKIQNYSYNEAIDVFKLLDKSEQLLFELSKSSIRKNYSNIKSLMINSFQELNIKRKNKNGITGIPSGFNELDFITSGWQKSDLIIIAARPGMGKTAFMLSILRNASILNKYPVAIFSLEMSSSQLVNRLLSIESEIEANKIKKGILENHEWEQLIYKTSKLSNAPIYIDDTPSLSIFELKTKCRRLKTNYDIQIVAIDYLQLMSNEINKKGFTNREQEIAYISRSLKEIAKEINIPIIALSQLSRAVEIRGGDKRPQLSDLRESGSIEQDADIVIFLYRPEYYNLNQGEAKNTAEIIIAKHRNGSLNKIKLKFLNQYTKFYNIKDK